MIAFCPVGAVQDFDVKQYCFMMDSSCPKQISSGFLPSGNQRLRIPPNVVVVFIVSWKEWWSLMWSSTISVALLDQYDDGHVAFGFPPALPTFPFW
jgi:hypothetical protein